MPAVPLLKLAANHRIVAVLGDLLAISYRVHIHAVFWEWYGNATSRSVPQ